MLRRTLGVIAAAVLMAPAAQAADLRVLSRSVAEVRDSGVVRVRFKAPRTLRVRVVVTRGGPALTEPRDVHVRRKRPREIPLRVSVAGKAGLQTCAGGPIEAVAYRARRLDRRPSRLAAASRVLDATGCTPAPTAPIPIPLPPGPCDPLDPAVCMQPFPSDHFTVADPGTATGRRIAFPPEGMPANTLGIRANATEWNRNDGFSPGSAIVTKVPGLDTPEALALTGAVPIDDLERTYDARQPVVVVDAATRKRHPVWTEVDTNAANPGDRNLIVRPAANFLEGRRYIVALRRMKDGAGNTIEPTAAFRALRDGAVTDNPALEARRPHAEALFRTLAEAGVRRDDLFLAWDFTVASGRSLTERMLAMRDDAFAKLGDTNLSDLTVQGSAPPFTITKVEEFPDGDILRRVEGQLLVPCYLNLPGCISGATFLYSEGGLPATLPGSTATARFTCNVPRAAARGTLLRPGLYGHGLLGSRGEVNQGQLKTLSNAYGFVFCATDWIGMACTDLPDDQTVAELLAGDALLPDCDIPTIGTILLDISNFPRLADRVQQGMLNQLYLGRLMIHPDGLSREAAFRVDGKPIIDTQRLYFDGNSQGAIIGGALTAVAPDFNRAVLGVGGMNYSTLLRRSVDFDRYATVLYNAYPSELERPLLLQLLQMQWDRAESNGYAQHITSNPLPDTPVHRVLMHIGLGDHQVSTYAAKVMARTVGARALTPWARPGRDTDKQPLFGLRRIRGRRAAGSGFVLWDSGSPPPPKEERPPREGQDPHEFPRRSRQGMRQKDMFLRPEGVVFDVCANFPCTTTPEG